MTVNMTIDSKDWWLPTATRIAQDTINGLGKSDDNVILLHDGGGDRQATVDALPVIIETVLAEGYHFVPVSSLIGLTPDQVMPRVAERVSPVGVVRNFGFAVVREAEKLIVALLTRWQAVEYITAQNLDRRAFELLNCITVVPGAVGAWRREKVLELAGFSTDTLAKDADLTVRILRAGYREVYEEDALAYTEAPATTKQLLKQRFRWMFGMLQVTQKHRGAMALKDSKSFALAGMPNILLFQILFPLLAPVADLVAVTTLIGLGIQIGTGSSLMGLQDGLMFLGLFGAFVLLDFMAAVIAFGHEKREDWRLLLWVLPQRFYYRQLLYIVAIRSVLMAIRGTAVGWGNLERKASVAVKIQPQT